MKRSVPTIQYRRKRIQKTNYRKRLGLLKSDKNRLVIRKSNKYIIIQVVSYIPNGDKIIKSCNSKELIKLGWKFSCKNIPAAYLTGLLIAKAMKSEKNKECIVDFGLQTPQKGYNKLYAVVKGAIEAGLVIPADKSVFPTDEEILGRTEVVQKASAEVKKKILG
jgi:large subunit ribosomal protein L18